MAEVNFSGPLFNGQADSALEAFKAYLGREVASEAWNTVQANMRASFRNPTGFYWGRVVKDFSRRDPRVHDNGVVYGGWLEGTSRRNAETRFKGYSSFRRATRAVTMQVPMIGERTLQRYIGAMG
jgi:hypothetical protein